MLHCACLSRTHATGGVPSWGGNSQAPYKAGVLGCDTLLKQFLCFLGKSMNNELLAFDTPGLCALLSDVPAEDLDALPFGVIGFDASGHIQRYNAYESKAAMFDPKTVIGQHVFVELAPCFNNYLVATRFEDAAAASEALDETMPYVLTFRMRPTRVQIRLLAQSDQGLRFILVLRTPAPAKA